MARMASSRSMASSGVWRPCSISRESWFTALTRSSRAPTRGMCLTRAKVLRPSPSEVRKMPLLRTKASASSTP